MFFLGKKSLRPLLNFNYCTLPHLQKLTGYVYANLNNHKCSPLHEVTRPCNLNKI